MRTETVSKLPQKHRSVVKNGLADDGNGWVFQC